MLTLLAILFTEALIFIPSASNARNAWLKERVDAARIAALALEAAPMRSVSDDLAHELLMKAEVYAVAEIEDDMHIQLLASDVPLEGTLHKLDLTKTTGLSRARDALGAFVAPADRILVVYAEGSAPGRTLEVVIPQAPMKADLFAFARRIAALSLLIAGIAALLIYIFLHWLVVRPMQRVTTSVVGFKSDPGSWTQRLKPTRRTDEIGRAQNALADMESAVAESFRQRGHLAELGAAVAKINHDLRNSLATAQLVSETLVRSDDPRVQRAAPRLERALKRAIELASATLSYGKATPRAPRLEVAALYPLLEEAAQEALAHANGVQLNLHVAHDARALCDTEHLHRIAANLMRNAAEAMIRASSAPALISVRHVDGALEFSDIGPGLSAVAQANLFKPFTGSGREGGTGLGLVIAHELAEAMGGRLDLIETSAAGTQFKLYLPRAAP